MRRLARISRSLGGPEYILTCRGEVVKSGCFREDEVLSHNTSRKRPLVYMEINSICLNRIIVPSRFAVSHSVSPST